MSSFFSNWFPFKIVRIGGSDDNTRTRSSVIGMNGSYVANQADKNMPFEEAYATSSDVYAIINKIARTGKTLPIRIKSVKGDNVDYVNSGELFDIINKPNVSQSIAEFIEQALLHILLSGNLYMYSDAPFGLVGSLSKPKEVFNLHPQLTEIKSEYNGFLNTVKNYVYHINNKEFKIDPSDIIHAKYANPTIYGIDTLYGLSPLIAGFMTLKGLTNNQTAHASILDNLGTAGILSNESDVILTPEERDLQQEMFDKRNNGAAKFGKIIQSMSKVRYTKLGLDPSQLQIIEGKALKMRDLCNIFDVPSVLFNDPQNRIQANLIPAETAFWNNAVIPNTNIVIKSMQAGIADKFSTDREVFILESVTDSVQALQKDAKTEAEKDRITIETVDKIMNMPVSSVAKKTLLMSEVGFDESTADFLLKPEGNANKSLDILKSLSPLLANKIIESLSEEEIRSLLK